MGLTVYVLAVLCIVSTVPGLEALHVTHRERAVDQTCANCVSCVASGGGNSCKARCPTPCKSIACVSCVHGGGGQSCKKQACVMPACGPCYDCVKGGGGTGCATSCPTACRTNQCITCAMGGGGNACVTNHCQSNPFGTTTPTTTATTTTLRTNGGSSSITTSNPNVLQPNTVTAPTRVTTAATATVPQPATNAASCPDWSLVAEAVAAYTYKVEGHETGGDSMFVLNANTRRFHFKGLPAWTFPNRGRIFRQDGQDGNELLAVGFETYYGGKMYKLLGFKGTSNTANWMQNLNNNLVTPNVGARCNGCRVHEGFYGALSQMHLPINDWLAGAGTRLFTGHSLGGALATDAVRRWGTAQSCLITFGQPRVGNQQYISMIDNKVGGPLRYLRFANDNDPVPKVPLERMGFKHGGRWITDDGLCALTARDVLGINCHSLANYYRVIPGTAFLHTPLLAVRPAVNWGQAGSLFN